MKIWCLDYNDRTYTDASFRDLPRFRRLNLFRGVSFSSSFPPDAVAEIRSARAPTDYFKAGVFWIVSTKLREILESHAVHAEYMPVKLQSRAAEVVVGNWFCFNPLLVRDWFDKSRSKFIPEKGFATEIESVAVIASEIEDVPLAVAAKTIPVLVGVSDDLAESIISAGCTGAVFRNPLAWRNPAAPPS